ncbi:MAG: hypothetical protein Q8861_02155 [Bacteroidota bacterium]|nr:hypothetical protein [Bacteroidota bacterium]
MSCLELAENMLTYDEIKQLAEDNIGMEVFVPNKGTAYLCGYSPDGLIVGFENGDGAWNNPAKSDVILKQYKTYSCRTNAVMLQLERKRRDAIKRSLRFKRIGCLLIIASALVVISLIEIAFNLLK